MKLNKLCVLAVTGIMLFSGSAIAFANPTPEAAPAAYEYEYTPIEAHTVLFDAHFALSAPPFVTFDFATPVTSSNNIQVFFQNTSSSLSVVTLERRNLVTNSWETVGSMYVAPETEEVLEMPGQRASTYRLRVNNRDGGQVSGYLRARQL